MPDHLTGTWDFNNNASKKKNMNNLVYIAPLVLGLSQILKGAGISTRYIPLIGVLIGVGLAFLLSGGYSTEALIQGLVGSLTAMGFYSGVKKTING
jgi:hypothetical protein